jgi:hypothetical protein
MAHVVITGWQPGLRKVGLAKLLRTQARLSLAQAHASVEQCLEGEDVVIGMNSMDEAEVLAREANALGAIAEVRHLEQQR